MATTAFGPLKITLPANLPKNEKDLICMMLAGRLKDLFRGRLLCAQLAVNDLLKDTIGIDALGGIRSGLNDLKGALTEFKAASGYNAILNKVNQALGSVSTVFSLGGLCPSPVHPPKIPDLLGQLNQNLFGQANSLLNALTRVANPSMCLGGGPDGFGVNWNSIDGDLKNLKRVLDQIKSNPAGYNSAIRAFENNLKNQTRRFKAELARLQTNFSDPLGLNQHKTTASVIQRTKNASDGYRVKDRRGVEYQNPTRAMSMGDVDYVVSRIDPVSNAPIRYETRPVLDYCGDISGFEKVVVSGDPAYAGWDMLPEIDGYNPDDFSSDNPTTNPKGTYAQYDYYVTEKNGQPIVYNTEGKEVSKIALVRGQHYRIGFELVNYTFKLYNGNALWNDGVTYTREPEHGFGMEVVSPDSTIEFVQGELDWAVLLENPTTPNTLKFKDGGAEIPVTVSGPTAMNRDDKIYDVSNAVRKALLHKKYDQYTGAAATLETEEDVERRYTSTSGNVNYTVTVNENEYDEVLDVFVETSTVTAVVEYGSQYLITRYVTRTDSGFELREIDFYISSTGSPEDAVYAVLLTFDKPINISSATKLLDPNPIPAKDQSYKIYYEYKLAILERSGGELIPAVPAILNADYMRFRLSSTSSADDTIKFNLTTNNRGETVPENEMVLELDIRISTADANRTYIESNPFLNKSYFKFTKPNGTGTIESQFVFDQEISSGSPSPSPVPSASPSPAATPVASPMAVPSASPSPVPTPTPSPAASPTAAPSATPVASPTASPTPSPSSGPLPAASVGPASFGFSLIFG